MVQKYAIDPRSYGADPLVITVPKSSGDAQIRELENQREARENVLLSQTWQNNFVDKPDYRSIISSILGIGILLFFVIVIGIYLYKTEPDRRDRRKQKWEQLQKKIRLLELQEITKKENAFRRYEELSKSIRRMSLYHDWKERVFDKFGEFCVVCRATENLEIHHRVSLYFLMKRYGIDSPVKAFECGALWNEDNGAVLCKTCHEQTKSHQYRNRKT